MVDINQALRLHYIQFDQIQERSAACQIKRLPWGSVGIYGLGSRLGAGIIESSH
ncbi:hypothetical protein PshuTeo1_20940 [Pseudomonas hunanensis]|nr:hypothetical protein PshuTeo1_20940 [Pseudomonas hunanensis]